jgi:hypothetical protein
MVRPALLLGAPAAAPREVVRPRLLRRLHRDGPDEIRAAGQPVDRHALDREVGVLFDEVREDPERLHGRGRPEGRDVPGGLGAVRPGERPKVGLEPVARGGTIEDRFEFLHGPNIVGHAPRLEADVYRLDGRPGR